QLAGGEEEQQQPAPAPVIGATAPRRPVSAEALPELGGLIISVENEEDLKEIMALIKVLQEEARRAEVEIHLVPLKYADATSVSTTLTNLYLRVNAGAGGNVR